jgi:hypothetical protein
MSPLTENALVEEGTKWRGLKQFYKDKSSKSCANLNPRKRNENTKVDSTGARSNPRDNPNLY